MAIEEENEETTTKTRKINKRIDGEKLVISIVGLDDTLEVDAAQLSDEVRQAAMMHGLSQKIGDSAAGKAEQEAYEAMEKVITALHEGDFTTRKAASPKINVADLVDNIRKMPEGPQKDAFIASLKASGVDLSLFGL